MLVIIATAPLWAAIGAVVFLKEQSPARTWWASIIALLGIVLVAWPDLSGGVNAGDIIALLTAWSMAGAFVLSRRTHANLALAPAMGGLLSALALAPFVRDLSFDQPNQILLMVLEGAMLVPLALGLIATAPKYLPAPQVGLFLLLETIFGPFWIWAFLGEAPTNYALIGGAVVILTLLFHSSLSLRASKKAANCTKRAVSLSASQIAHR
jgi:drug/metabolite transporter (DMT)-like permease